MFAKKIVLASLFATAAATSFAGELNAWDNQPVQAEASVLTRAEVRADAVKALKDGQIAMGEVGSTAIVAPAATRSRAEVRAEAIAAARDPSLHNLYIN